MKQKSEIKRTGPELLKRLLRQREMSVFLIILLVVAIVAIVNPKFIQPSNMKSIALSGHRRPALHRTDPGSDSGRH